MATGGATTKTQLSPEGVWRIDTTHTQVGFSISHLGISTVHGQFSDYDGAATIGPDLDTTCVELTVRTGSINTANSWRDGHLVGEKFFDCENFPEMTFRSSSIEATGDRYSLAGDLTIKGISRPVVFDLQFCGTALFPMDEKIHAGFCATTTVKRSDFDIDYGVPLAADEVVLRIDAQLIAPEAASLGT